MLLGLYRHTLDAKGRVIVPVRFREDLGESFIITRGLDNCLSLYSMSEWASLEEKVKSLPMAQSRSIQRFLFANAFPVELDGQGRIVVPANLKIYAGLTKEVVITGVSTRAEIWDAALWDSSQEETSSEDVANLMSELGF